MSAFAVWELIKIYISWMLLKHQQQHNKTKKRENGTVCRVESRAPTGRKWPEHICTPSSTNNKERDEGGNPETGSIQPVVKTNPGPFFYTPLSLSDSPFYITVSSIFFFSLLLTFNVNTTIYFVCPTFGSVSFFWTTRGKIRQITARSRNNHF